MDSISLEHKGAVPRNGQRKARWKSDFKSSLCVLPGVAFLEAAAHPEPVASGVPSPTPWSGLCVFSFLFFSGDDLTAVHFLPAIVGVTLPPPTGRNVGSKAKITDPRSGFFATSISLVRSLSCPTSRSTPLQSRTLLNPSVSPASLPAMVASSPMDLEVRCVGGPPLGDGSQRCVTKPIASCRLAVTQAREAVTAAKAKSQTTSAPEDRKSLFFVLTLR